jgi:hypothetical protein
VQKGTSRGFSRMWDEKLKAVEAHKKKQAALKLKAVSAFSTSSAPAAGSNAAGSAAATLGGKLAAFAAAAASGAKAPPEQQRQQRQQGGASTPTPPTGAKPGSSPPPSPRGFKTVASAGADLAKQPTLDTLAKRRWRSAAPMPRPRRWLHLLVAALPDPPPEPELPPPRSKPNTPLANPAPLRGADLPPVQPKVAETPEEVAELVKQLSSVGQKQPSSSEEAKERFSHKPVAPSAGFGIFG